MRTVAIHNLGCKVNSYEAESMEQLLKGAGYNIVPFSEEYLADVYIINTCSVTNIADRKSRQMLHKAKRMNPDAVVVAAGCYVQADADNAKADEAVDIILGNNKKIDIVAALEEYFANTDNSSFVVDIAKDNTYEALSIDSVNEHTRAYIKIQDGCNQFCSYCIIPYTRGRIRSRALADIVEEVERLVTKGYKEIVLTGIHLSSYGLEKKNVVSPEGVQEDYQTLASEGGDTLLDVVKAVNSIEGVERIRLGSLEPRIITDEFARMLATMHKVCPHFHLSLQSGCDSVLKRMNRKYTTDEYYSKCEILRKYFYNPAITTDVIVGFPGETDEEFEATKAFLEKVHFYEMHIFKYSRRKGTVADKMPGQVPDSVKTERSNELLKLADKMSKEYRESNLGNKKGVLFEECQIIDGKKVYTGYTINYIRVNVSFEDAEMVAKKCLGNNCNVDEAVINNIARVELKRIDDHGAVAGKMLALSK